MGIVQICAITAICGVLTNVYAENIAEIYTNDAELIANLVPLLHSLSLPLTLLGFTLSL